MAEANNTARATTKSVRKNRFLRAAWESLKVTARSVQRTLAVLFHQITGMFFLFFALIGAVGLWHEHQVLHGAPWNLRMWAAAVFTAMFTWFAVSSYATVLKYSR